MHFVGKCIPRLFFLGIQASSAPLLARRSEFHEGDKTLSLILFDHEIRQDLGQYVVTFSTAALPSKSWFAFWILMTLGSNMTTESLGNPTKHPNVCVRNLYGSLCLQIISGCALSEIGADPDAPLAVNDTGHVGQFCWQPI
jgi:hypothetical protein